MMKESTLSIYIVVISDKGKNNSYVKSLKRDLGDNTNRQFFFQSIFNEYIAQTS